MGTMVMKFIALLALVIAKAISPTSNLQVVLGFAVFISGGAVAIQAMRSSKYAWSILFCLIAMVFNPFLIVPAEYSRHFFFIAACGLSFVLSLFLLGNMPKKTIASITAPSGGSNSL